VDQRKQAFVNYVDKLWQEIRFDTNVQMLRLFCPVYTFKRVQIGGANKRQIHFFKREILVVYRVLNFAVRNQKNFVKIFVRVQGRDGQIPNMQINGKRRI
jgi:hypothetical protein